MSKLITENISHHSFNGIGHKIVIRNETSRTQFTKSDLILIRELKDNGIILELPQNICQEGHNLTLFILRSNADVKFTLPESGKLKDAITEILVKVEHLEPNLEREHSVFVEMIFTQIDMRVWKNIQNEYVENHKKIDAMMLKQQGN